MNERCQRKGSVEKQRSKENSHSDRLEESVGWYKYCRRIENVISRCSQQVEISEPI